MGLHGYDVSYVVIPIPETADLLGLREAAGLVSRTRHLALMCVKVLGLTKALFT